MRWLVLVPLVAAACTSPPPDHHHRGTPWEGMKRVLAIDFSAKAAGTRANAFTRLPRAAAHELQRSADVAPSAKALADELTRPVAAADRAEDLVSREVRRRPHVPKGLVPTPVEFARDLGNALTVVPVLLVFENQPLGEPTDRRHATSPAEWEGGHEATLWQRLRRRLWL
jgi:hypothetical protein